MMSKFGSIVTMLAVVFALTGCGSAPGSASYHTEDSYQTASSGGSATYNSMATESAATESAKAESAMTESVQDKSAMAEEGTVEPESTQIMEEGRKLIKHLSLDVETENYDVLIPSLQEQVKKLGGYTERLSDNQGTAYGEYARQNRNAYMTLRIPQNKLDEFVKEVEQISNITYRNETVEDVTLQYVDLESHKKVLLIEQERLLSFLERAETIEDVIALESRLSEVRYQLETMEAQLRTMDNLIQYSTVELSVQEVVRFTPKEEVGTWEQIKLGFGEDLYYTKERCKYAFISFVSHLPSITIKLVLLGILLFVIWAINKKWNILGIKSKRQLPKKEVKPTQPTIEESNIEKKE